MHLSSSVRGCPSACIAIGLLLFTASAQASDAAFPLRAKYPTVKTISTAELHSRFGSILIVDVRSKLEFDVIHINGALHIPVADESFVSRVKAILEREPAKNPVFYCNGTTCAKSYKAAVALMEAGTTTALTYDAGIPEWVQVHPERSTLLGKSPADPKRMISKEAFKKRLLPYEEFAKKASSKGVMVVDVRESIQRSSDRDLPQNQPLKVPSYRSIPSDKLAAALSKKSFKKALQGKTLMVADAVGKQVRWLQYFLEDNGYKDYYFLEEGVLGASKVGGTGLWR